MMVPRALYIHCLLVLSLLAALTVSAQNSTDDDSINAGYSCRMAVLNDWVATYSAAADNNNSTSSSSSSSSEAQSADDSDYIQSLMTIQRTSRYEMIRSDCEFYIDEFNIAAGATCLLRQEQITTTSHSDFWQIGAVNMDGNWSLSVDMLRSNNFQDIGPMIPCANSCYTIKDPDLECGIGASTYFGKIPQEQVCYLEWSDLDSTSNDLRLCAAESNAARVMIAEKNKGGGSDDINNLSNSLNNRNAIAIVKAYAAERKTQSDCSANACDKNDDSNGVPIILVGGQSDNAEVIGYFGAVKWILITILTMALIIIVWMIARNKVRRETIQSPGS